MGFLIGFLLAMLLFFAGSSVMDEGSAESQACAVSEDGIERCGPTLIDDRYQVPGDGIVIRSFVHSGPISPEFQEGYEIVVDAAGTVTITETPQGASSDLPESERDAEETVRTEEIGSEGLQGLLRDLDGCGAFYLPQRGEMSDEEMPIGGSVNDLEIRLDDGRWDVSGALLEGDDAGNLKACQGMLAEKFGVLGPA